MGPIPGVGTKILWGRWVLGLRVGGRGVDFPGGSTVNNLSVNARDVSSVHVGSISRSPGEGNGNPLQYSCLGNPMDRGVWQATVHGVTKS